MPNIEVPNPNLNPDEQRNLIRKLIQEYRNISSAEDPILAFNNKTESPDQFRSRIEQLFPDDYQLALIDAYWESARLFSSAGIRALSLRLDTLVPDSKYESLFPRSLNESLYDLTLPREQDDYTISANPTFSSQVISSANLAIYRLEKLGQQRIEQVSKYVQDALESGAHDTTLSRKNRLLARAYRLVANRLSHRSQMQMRQDTYNIIQSKIDPGSIDADFSLAIRGFSTIRDQVNGQCDAIQMHTSLIEASSAFPLLQMPDSLANEINKAVNHHLDSSK